MWDELHQNSNLVPEKRATFDWIKRFYSLRGSHPQLIGLQTPDGKSYSYQKLNIESNRRAHWLLGQNIKVGNLCAIHFERTDPEAIFWLLALLKVGACVYQMETELSQSVLAEKLSHLEPKLVISHNDEFLEFATKNVGIHNPDVSQFATDDVLISVPPSSPSFVILSSGTTGKPKMIQIPRSALAPLVWAAERYLKLKPGKKILQIASRNFDAAVFEFVAPLGCGAQIIMTTQEQRLTGELFFQTLKKSNIDSLVVTPSHISGLIKQHSPGPIPLETMLLVGEAFDVSLLDQLEPLSISEVFNSYGASETGIWTFTQKVLEKKKRFPIELGEPLPQVKYLIMTKENGQWRKVNVGEPGVLFIENNLPHVYLNSALNKKRYVRYLDSLFYVTGDIVRQIPDKTQTRITFQGRQDFQIKINGQLVAPEEVINTLNLATQKLSISHNYTWHVMGEKNIAGKQELNAYVAGENLNTQEIEDIIQESSKSLEPYKMPVGVYHVSKFPLKIGGKLDTEALKNSAQPFAKPKTVTPLTPFGKKALNAIKELKKPINTESSFTELGFDSLMLNQTSYILAREFGIPTDLLRPLIFKGQPVALFFNQLESLLGVKRLSIKNLAEDTSLTHYLKNLLLACKLNPSAYNEPVALYFNQVVNPKKIQAGLKEIVNRHPALRTSFREEKSVYKKQVSPTALLDWKETEEASNIEKEISNHFLKPFDLTKPPLFRAFFVKNPNGDKLFLSFHHSIMDGHSIAIFMQELEALYFNQPLQPLSAKIEQEVKPWVLQKKYWEKQLSKLPKKYPFEDLPQAGTAFVYSKQILNSKELARLKECCQSLNVSLFTFLLTCFKIATAQKTGTKHLVTGTTTTLRELDNQNGFGYFLNTLALNTHLQPVFLDYLLSVKKSLLGALENREFPYGEIAPLLGVKKPLFDNAFVLEPKASKSPNGWEYLQDHIKKRPAKIPFYIEAEEKTEGLYVRGEIHQNIGGKEYFEDWSGLFKNSLTTFSQSPHKSINVASVFPPQKLEAPTDGLDSRSLLKVQSIMATVLKKPLSQVPQDQSFSNLGGDSLQVVILLKQLQETFTNELSMEELRSTTMTTESISGLMANKGAFRLSNSFVVPLKTSNKFPRKSFFFVHPGDGEIWAFNQLAKSFPNNTRFFGIKYKPEFKNKSIEELAQIYAREIQAQNIPGDISVGAFCAGGPIAIEMVRLFEKQGPFIKELLLLDTPPPQNLPEYTDTAQRLSDYFDLAHGVWINPKTLREKANSPLDQLREVLRRSQQMGKPLKPFSYYQKHLQAVLFHEETQGISQNIINSFCSLFDLSPDEISQKLFSPEINTTPSLIQALTTMGKEKGKIPPDFDQQYFLNITDVANSLHRALKSYQPKKLKTKTAIRFFYTKPSKKLPLGWSPNPKAWKKFLPNMKAHVISGDHFSMLKNPESCKQLTEMIFEGQL